MERDPNATPFASGGRPLRVLVLGFGNPGRLDDGLGPAAARAIEAAAIPGVRTEAPYQLELEDAALAAEHDAVVFVDASRTESPPFGFREVRPRTHHEFTTHSLAPEAVLGVARDVLGATPRGFVLAIRGEEFDGFGEWLSAPAAAHLGAATRFLEDALRSGLSAACASEV
ncbi:MAG: hydrogenase maturation protease [Planctomycetes bacterium]|nr:hydrogenase maturation protease [Planctomycetota bacterium]